LLTFNVTLQIGKGTPEGTCTPDWETLYYTDKGFSWISVIWIQKKTAVFTKTPTAC